RDCRRAFGDYARHALLVNGLCLRIVRVVLSVWLCRSLRVAAIRMSVVAARMCAVVSVAGEAKVAGDAFGGELDRRERVLDLVRHAARDFAPCGRTLGGEQLGQVLDDEGDAARRRS